MGRPSADHDVSRSRRSGMTLIEIMAAVLLLLPLLTVVMQTFITCAHLNASAEGISKAIWQERTLVAAIEKTRFQDIYSTYNDRSFPLSGLTGSMAVHVEQADADLWAVYVSATWKDIRGRYNGEDVNLNGRLDDGEDRNANGRLDSNVGFATFIYDKG